MIKSTFIALLIFANSLLAEDFGPEPHLTPYEQSLVKRIGAASQVFYAECGRFPLNWEEIGNHYYDVEGQNNVLKRNQSPLFPIQENYVFVNQPVQLTESNQVQLILIKRNPEERDGLLGRYLIFGEGKGQTRSNWMPESEVKEILLRSGIAVPEPKTPTQIKQNTETNSPEATIDNQSNRPSVETPPKKIDQKSLNVQSNKTVSTDTAKPISFYVTIIFVGIVICFSLFYFLRRK
jgi:hypothetical protein